MQLTRFTDLALRIVMRLSVLEEGQSATAAGLAEQLHVRRAHAAKVVTALGRLGVVETRRGRTGGLSLAASARDTSVGWIVRELEGPGEVVECDGAEPCPLRTGCRLRRALREAQEAFYASLDPLTIDDVAAAPTRALLLSIGSGPID
ncbi:transcriptional regulator, BadM/Rrf2 family [Nocardioides sp. YR527]|uniref:RrF2 family transcriptional regulator n=1 Tax=Nocardioides sp. YR527 TaxID=1881028 RepID=UPI0008862B11|nr:Rrf2 family transcriptional regulator [Nocardioides sp. YR527]SDJ88514.1 transcriptional regulator, BadM/Rrf2 family [Nocardioides sp. YR527]